MLQVNSVGFNKTLKSGIKVFEKNFEAKRGFNIYGIFSDGKVVYNNFDTWGTEVTDKLISCVNDLYFNKNCDKIIGLVEDDAQSKLNKINVQKQLLIGLEKIGDLGFRDSYYFIYDNKNKKLDDEQISKTTCLTNKMQLDITQYIVVTNEFMFQFVEEYLDSVKSTVNMGYYLTHFPEQVQYIDSPYVKYVFIQTINENLLTKPFSKILINTEQLTRTDWLLKMKHYLNLGVQLLDYSPENIKLLGSPEVKYLPYLYNDSEVNKLKKFYSETPKKYDFAFCGPVSEKRKFIIENLILNGATVKLVSGFGDARDKDIAECKVLLNIHYANDYNVYESLRCDRWVFAGMPIVSESSVDSSNLDISKVVNFYPYEGLIQGALDFIQKIEYPKEEDVLTIKEYRNKLFSEIKYFN